MHHIKHLTWPEKLITLALAKSFYIIQTLDKAGALSHLLEFLFLQKIHVHVFQHHICKHRTQTARESKKQYNLNYFKIMNHFV